MPEVTTRSLRGFGPAAEEAGMPKLLPWLLEEFKVRAAPMYLKAFRSAVDKPTF